MYAFSACTGLTSVSVAVPDPASITLGIYVFTGVPVATATLKVLPGSVAAYGAAAQWSAFGTIVGDGSLSTNDYILASAFSVYPNPAENTLFIKQNAAQGLENVSIYTTQGKQVLYSTNKTLDVSGLSRGFYIVKITTTAGSITKKLIKK